MAILHLQRFGINVDDTWPEPNEDGTYPNDDDDKIKKHHEIDEMITDESVDADSMEPEEDDDDLCVTAAGVTARTLFQVTDMSDTKNDFDGELNNEFWREYIENREMLAQLRDSEVAKKFWDERP